MIATSDNMATDLLIERLGTRAIEEALASAGHHDPASMTPFPTMYELFSVGWGKPDLRDQWKHATQQVRAQILRQTNSTPYQPDPTRAHTPASNYGAEWYGSAEISAVCTRHCEPTRSARPRPSDRSCPPSRVSSWTAACGPISARKQVACQAI